MTVLKALTIMREGFSREIRFLEQLKARTNNPENIHATKMVIRRMQVLRRKLDREISAECLPKEAEIVSAGAHLRGGI